jgi:copper chaperone
MKTILRSDDFSCPSCVSKLEAALAKVAGVEAARVHFATGRIVIEHEPDRASVETLVETVRRSGYRARAAAF